MEFEVYKSLRNNHHYFQLTGEKGEPLLSSEAYVTRTELSNGMRAVRKNAVESANFEVKSSNDGRSYFLLKAQNGKVVGVSKRYNSTEDLKNVIVAITELAQAE